TLDNQIRALAEALIAANASSVITGMALDRLNQKLLAQRLHKVLKREWAGKLKEAKATQAVNHPTADSRAADDAAVRVSDVLPGAPVPDEAVVPRGWKLMPEGVFRVGLAGDVETLTAPLVILARLTDTGDQTESLRLAWHRDGQWREFVCG